MRNFDYLQDLGLTELHQFCSAAEEPQCHQRKKGIGVYGQVAVCDEEHRDTRKGIAV